MVRPDTECYSFIAAALGDWTSIGKFCAARQRLVAGGTAPRRESTCFDSK